MFNWWWKYFWIIFSRCAAINRTLENGIALTDPKFYKEITKSQLDEYLMGDSSVPCPMIEERVKCLHGKLNQISCNLQIQNDFYWLRWSSFFAEIGNVLMEKYQGSFINCLKNCNKSAMELLKTVVSDFKCFDDTHDFHGEKVSIHKRAQILVADLWQLFEGQGLCDFSDIDDITMFADYRVPQSLQYFEALQYRSQSFTFFDGDFNVLSRYRY